MLAVLGAACCWGALGVSYDLILERYPTGPVTVVTLRATTAAAVLLVWVLLTRSNRAALAELRRWRTAALALVGGAVSTAAFYVALIYAFREAGVAVATVLLYLGPAMVVAASSILFRQRIGIPQKLALGMTMLGIGGVSGALGGIGQVHVLGIALGVASAVGYASYSIIGQLLLRSLPPLLVVATVMMTGAICLWIAKLAVDGTSMPAVTGIILIALVNGVGTTLAPMLLYTWGLSRLGPPRASILATLEPVVGVSLAFAILGESFSPSQVAGALLVLVSVAVAAGVGRAS